MPKNFDVALFSIICIHRRRKLVDETNKIKTFSNIPNPTTKQAICNNDIGFQGLSTKLQRPVYFRFQDRGNRECEKYLFVLGSVKGMGMNFNYLQGLQGHDSGVV